MTTRNIPIWQDPLEVTPSAAVAQAVGGHPLLARILAQRGFVSLESAQAFLSPSHYSPTPPAELPDLERAASFLSKAITDRAKILIWGDFDVDGQTSTSLLLDALRRLGANADFYIPDRQRESHGIRLDSLQKQIDRLCPGVLLTCDTGVSEHGSIDYAKSQGIITLVTDHHDLPPSLPAADAVVNPKRLAPVHPLASLPGVGVAYKLVEYLYTQAGRADELTRLLDLVALGIVADVAQQTHDTRYLLQIGLDCLRNTQRVGLQALIQMAEIPAQRLSAADIGFQLGPRLNAAGRLGDASPVIELLTTDDPARAHMLALQLEGLNNQRRLLNRQIYGAAQDQIAQDPALLDWEALVIARPGWHAGVIGIVASRLAEYYQRPTVLLSIAEDGIARGSARSAPGYDIGGSIAAVSDLLLSHGGHPGAAGCSLPVDHLPAFRRRLSDTLHETRDPSVRPGLTLDAFVTLAEVTPELANDLDRLAPFGEGNPRITLATRDLTLKSAAFIGRSREHRRLTVQDSAGNRQHVIWWNSADQLLPEGLFDLAYQLEMSTYQDKTELQLVLQDYRRSASAPVEIQPAQRHVIDHRRSPYPDATLRDLLEDYPSAVVWAEGYRRAESPGLPLSELSEAERLIIYTAPSGPQALYKALQRVKPLTIDVIAVPPPTDGISDVLRRVLSLIKYVLNQQAGQTILAALSESVGQSAATIRLVLDYVVANGEIDVEYTRQNAITITPASRPPAPDIPDRLAALQASIAETGAYRAFFRRADLPYLFDEPIVE